MQNLFCANEQIEFLANIHSAKSVLQKGMNDQAEEKIKWHDPSPREQTRASVEGRVKEGLLKTCSQSDALFMACGDHKVLDVSISVSEMSAVFRKGASSG